MNLQPYLEKCPNCDRLPEPNRLFCPGCGRALEMYDADDNFSDDNPHNPVFDSPYWSDGGVSSRGRRRGHSVWSD